MVLHIFLGLLLLLIPAGALYLFDRSLLRTLGIAVVRMVAQLLVLCLIVWALVKFDNIWLSLLWLVLLAVVSGVLALRRIKLPIARFLLPVSAGLLVSALLVGAYLLWACLPAENGFGARWFVPVMALLVGQTLTTIIRGLSTYQSALKADEQQYEFLRGNGQSHFNALKPFLRRSLLAVISPTIANLSVLCLTSMPLLLCGIFLGGMTPINAFVLMLHMTVGCVATSVLALAITVWLSDRLLFDKFGKLQ